MTVQEIFKLPEIKEVECEILTLETDMRLRTYKEDSKREIIKELLRIRKNLLDNKFCINEEYAHLLGEFNESLRQTLVKLKRQMVEAYDAIDRTGIEGRLEAVGKCFLAYQYSSFHPVQTIRAKKMWQILNGSIDNYVDLYDDGVDGFGNVFRGSEYERKHLLDDIQEDGFNFNHHLESKYTNNMHIILPTHFLYDDKSFSIFDILWVRNFDIEVHTEVDYRTYELNEEDWPEFDEIDFNNDD